MAVLLPVAAHAQKSDGVCTAPWTPLGNSLSFHITAVGNADNPRATWTWCFRNESQKKITSLRFGYSDADGDHTDILPFSLDPGHGFGGWAAFTSTGRPTRFWIIELKFKGDDEAEAARQQALEQQREQQRQQEQQRQEQLAEQQRQRDLYAQQQQAAAEQRQQALEARRAAAQRQIEQMQENLNQQREQALSQYDDIDDQDIQRETKRLSDGLDEDGRLMESINSRLESASGERLRDALQSAIESAERQEERARKDAESAQSIGSSLTTILTGIGRAVAQDPNAQAALKRKQDAANSLHDAQEQRAERWSDEADQLRDQLRDVENTLAEAREGDGGSGNGGGTGSGGGYTPTLQAAPTPPAPTPEASGADIPSLGARFTGMKFFEQGNGALTPLNSRVYATSFNATTARYIGVELSFDFASALSQTSDVPIDCVFRNGSIEWTSHRTMQPQASWTGVVSAALLGWSEAGHWPAGNYTVTCSAEGHSFGGSSFTILGPPDIPSLQARLTSMKFWEEGSGAMTPYGQRNYATQFSAQSTRYIGIELNFSLDAALPATTTVPVHCVLHNGTIAWNEDRTVSPQATWTGFVSGSVIGWADAGHWPVGTYTVNCSAEGRTFGAGTFEIVNGPTAP